MPKAISLLNGEKNIPVSERSAKKVPGDSGKDRWFFNSCL
jgi:hypothetical protein